MKPAITGVLFSTLAFIGLAFAADRIQIGTAAGEETPHGGSGIAEPLAVSGFYFEVNAETSRARIVVDYSWKNPAIVAGYDFNGPKPTYLQLAGLTFNPKSGEVIFARAGQSTVCGRVRKDHNIFGARLTVVNTGSCRVTGQEVFHSEDDGWSIHKIRAIDLFLEVR